MRDTNWTEVPGSEYIVNIGTRKQLFFDDEIIETRRWITPHPSKSAALLVETPEETDALHKAESERGTDVSAGIPGHVLMGTHHVRRTQHRPVKHPGNPIVTRDRPWEGPSAERWRIMNPFVMFDEEEEIWKMWYGTLGGLEGSGDDAKGDLANVGCFTLYATSLDGVEWEKPDLSLVEFDGSAANNIVYKKDGVTYCYLAPNFVKDPHDAEPGKWRYKGFVKTKPDQSVAVSPDGLHWEIIGTFQRIGDENVGFFYDKENSLYVGFTRNLYRKPAYGRPTFPQLRSHRTYTTAFSKDLVQWSHPRQVLAPDRDDSMDAEFETILGFCYEGLYLAVLGVNRRTDGFGNASDNQLAYSRDGLHWERMSERKSFMLPDPDAGWEELTNQPSCFVVRDDKIHIYYTGFTLRGDYTCESIGLATLRLDGFVSLDGIKRKGEQSKGVPYQSTLFTRPLWSSGNRLVVNAETKEYISAELTDPDGRVIPGFGQADCDTFTGDSIRHTFSWKGREDIGGLFPLRIRFRMRDARLYSLQVSDQ